MLGGQQDSPGGPAQTLFSASGGSCGVSKGLDPGTAPGSSHPASPPYPRHKITGLQAAGLEPRTTGPLSHPDVVSAPQCSDHRPPPPPPMAPGASRPTGTRLDPAGLCQPHYPSMFHPNSPPQETTQSPSLGSKVHGFGFLPSFTHSLFIHSNHSILGQAQCWPWGCSKEQGSQRASPRCSWSIQKVSDPSPDCCVTSKSLPLSEPPPLWPEGPVGVRGPGLRDGVIGT